MCSFFGAGEKLEAKIEDLVKKFEDRFADIEDKVIVQFILNLTLRTPFRYLSGTTKQNIHKFRLQL